MELKAFFSTLIITLLIIASCVEVKHLNPDQLVRWVMDEENGLLEKIEKGNFSYVLFYKPLELMALQELNWNSQFDIERFESVKESYKGMEYYTFRIQSKKGANNPMDEILEGRSQDEIVKYLSFEMQNDFSLVVDTDTFSCELFHYEQSFQGAPYLTFSLGFDVPSEERTDRVLIYRDHILRNGLIAFKLKKEDIHNIPLLKI